MSTPRLRVRHVNAFEVPPQLTWITSEPGGAEWLQTLPILTREVAECWQITIGTPFAKSHVSYTAPCELSDGTGAVVKIQFPDREVEFEAAALAAWGGNGAVQLLKHDADRHALLIERCSPGASLSELALEDALDVYCDLLPRLWIATEIPIATLADEARWWESYLLDRYQQAGSVIPRHWIDIATGLVSDLADSQGPSVVLHQDLHADNVLRSQRLPWLAIDPKPLLGEREFSIAPIIRSHELGHSKQAVLHRLDRLCGDLELDRDRARGWTIVQSIAWGLESHNTRHHDTIGWLLESE